MHVCSRSDSLARSWWWCRSANETLVARKTHIGRQWLVDSLCGQYSCGSREASWHHDPSMARWSAVQRGTRMRAIISLTSLVTIGRYHLVTHTARPIIESNCFSAPSATAQAVVSLHSPDRCAMSAANTVLLTIRIRNILRISPFAPHSIPRLASTRAHRGLTVEQQ